MAPYNKQGWNQSDTSTKKEELNRHCSKPWRYQTPAETDTVPKWGRFHLYSGGGFVADLGYEINISLGIIEMLQKHGWLDLQSRAVIFEFYAFNPPSNLLVVVTYFYEIHPSRFKAPFQRIKTISLPSKETNAYKFYLLCVLIFLILVLLYMARICYTVYHQRWRFFISFWNWVEILQVVFSVLAIAMNIVHSSIALSTIRRMRTNIYANVNFQEVIAWTEAEYGVLGFLLFFVSLKLLRIIRYNKQVAIFSKTLADSTKVFLSFMVLFMIGFMAFMHCGILVFGMGSEKYSSPLKAAYFQLELVLRKIRRGPIDELSHANRQFGRIFAILILVSLTIIFMNFFIAAINDALFAAKNSVAPNKLCDPVQELNVDNNKQEKYLSDTTEAIRENTTKNAGDKIAGMRRKVPKSIQKTKINANSKGKQTPRSFTDNASLKTKPKTTRRKLLHDKISIAVRQWKCKPLENDDAELQVKKLREKEKRLFRCLEKILHLDNEEEESCNLVTRFVEKQLACRLNARSSVKPQSAEVSMALSFSSSTAITATRKADYTDEEYFSNQRTRLVEKQLDRRLNTRSLVKPQSAAVSMVLSSSSPEIPATRKPDYAVEEPCNLVPRSVERQMACRLNTRSLVRPQSAAASVVSSSSSSGIATARKADYTDEQSFCNLVTKLVEKQLDSRLSRSSVKPLSAAASMASSSPSTEIAVTRKADYAEEELYNLVTRSEKRQMACRLNTRSSVKPPSAAASMLSSSSPTEIAVTRKADYTAEEPCNLVTRSVERQTACGLNTRSSSGTVSMVSSSSASEISAARTFLKIKSKHFSPVPVSRIPQARTRLLAHGYVSRYDPQRLENIRQTNI